ncbi:MAG: hypothetical protein ABH833_03730, partial [Parcubacteria group bacterium]
MDNQRTSNQKCAVIISSCDSYNDLWDPFFRLFFKYWPDCPFETYLIANNKEYPNNKISSIRVGEDRGWSDNIRTVLDKINTPYILYLQDDYLLQDSVDTRHMLTLLKYMQEKNVGCLRIFPQPGPDEEYDNNLG